MQSVCVSTYFPRVCVCVFASVRVCASTVVNTVHTSCPTVLKIFRRTMSTTCSAELVDTEPSHEETHFIECGEAGTRTPAPGAPPPPARRRRNYIGLSRRINHGVRRCEQVKWFPRGTTSLSPRRGPVRYRGKRARSRTQQQLRCNGIQRAPGPTDLKPPCTRTLYWVHQRYLEAWTVGTGTHRPQAFVYWVYRWHLKRWGQWVLVSRT